MTFLNRFRGQKSSANAAKERLQLVLIHDRAGLSPARLEALKDEMIAVISRHIEIDQRAVNVSLTNERNRQRLVADIPLVSQASRRR
jgi:cell division topological specificity factor